MDKIFGRIISKSDRSRIMSKIRGSRTGLEKRIAIHLSSLGCKFTVQPKMKGKPDFAIKKNKVVIFVDSCFWHGCKKHGKIPKTRRQFWATKIENNKKRDRAITRHYRKLNWRVVRIWEHDIMKDIRRAVPKL